MPGGRPATAPTGSPDVAATDENYPGQRPRLVQRLGRGLAAVVSLVSLCQDAAPRLTGQAATFFLLSSFLVCLIQVAYDEHRIIPGQHVVITYLLVYAYARLHRGDQPGVVMTRLYL